MASQIQFLFGDHAKPVEAVDFPSFPKNIDLADDVAYLLSWFQKAGYEVLIHDQTSPEQHSLGLSNIKVIIPGFLPVSFGTNRQRIRNLTRLKEVPVLLGLRDKPLSNQEINRAPHPMS